MTIFASYEASVAQDNSTLPKWALRTVPIKIVDPINPGLEFQVERQLSKRLSAQLTGAWLFKGLSSYYLSLNGARGLMGMKYFFAEERAPKEHTRYYAMLEGGIAKAVHRRDGFFAPPFDTVGELRIDRYNTTKQTIYGNMRVGLEVIFSRRWTGDLSLGLGVKFRDVRHSERDIPAHVLTLEEPAMFAFTFGGLQEGQSVWVNFPCSLGIGYRTGR